MEFQVFDKKKILGNRITSILLGFSIVFFIKIIIEHLIINLILDYNVVILAGAILSIIINSRKFFGSIGTIVFNNNSIDIRLKEKYNRRYFLTKKTYVKLSYIKQSNFTFKTIVEILINDENQNVIFYINGKNQKENFINIIEEYYINGYNFGEIEELGEKVFLTKANLNCSEVQRIKEKYKTGWI